MFKLATHSGKLERWLGKETLEHMSLCMRGAREETRWYGRPIAVAGVPGRVYVGRDGDFRGRIMTGLEASIFDVAESLARRAKRGFQGAAQAQLATANSGFSSLGDLITAATTPGRKRMHLYQKVGVTGTANAQTSTLWQSVNWPAAGAAASAAPGGRATSSSTTGAMPFTNPTSPQTQHLTTGFCQPSVVNCTLLLYDRIFDVAKTMNSTATEAVTGVPTRYTNTTAGSADSAENNFLFIETQTVLPATAHNWTVCKYTSQNGTTGQSLPSVTGNTSNAAQRLDMPLSTWFCPLVTGDSGLTALTQMQCSALVATGATNFVMGHPIAWMPQINAIQTMNAYDGVSSAFSVERIFDNACLSFLEPIRPTTTACTYVGMLSTCCN